MWRTESILFTFGQKKWKRIFYFSFPLCLRPSKYPTISDCTTYWLIVYYFKGQNWTSGRQTILSVLNIFVVYTILFICFFYVSYKQPNKLFFLILSIYVSALNIFFLNCCNYVQHNLLIYVQGRNWDKWSWKCIHLYKRVCCKILHPRYWFTCWEISQTGQMTCASLQRPRKRRK